MITNEKIVLDIINKKGNCGNLFCRFCPLQVLVDQDSHCKSDAESYEVAIRYAVKQYYITEEQAFELLL